MMEVHPLNITGSLDAGMAILAVEDKTVPAVARDFTSTGLAAHAVSREGRMTATNGTNGSPTPLRAAIIARKSNDDSDKEVQSTTRQIEHARAYAARKGWTVVEEFVKEDVGISGTDWRRPG